MNNPETTTDNGISQEEEAIRYRALVDSMNDGFGIVNDEGIFTYVNSHFANMLEYSEDEMIGKALLDFADKKNKKIIRENVRKRTRGEATQYEVEWTKKNGDQIPTFF